MTNLLYYLKGTILVKLLSNTPERFLNICNANNIVLWDLYFNDDNYYFKITPAEYFKLKKILKKTASKTIIVEKIGLPFLLFTYRKHYCFLIGIALAILLLYGSSLFVWDISVEGNFRITDDVMVDALNTQGIRHGMFIRQIESNEIEKFLRNEFKDLTWVSCEVNGTRLIIYVKENDEDYVEQISTNPCDLTATKDGVISSIITRSGTPLVKAGDIVKAGDVLVSGIVNVYDDYGTVVSTKNVYSDADILIQTVYNYEDSVKIRYKYKLFSGEESKRSYVKFLDYIMKTGFNPEYENYDQVLSDYQIKFSSNFYLPIHYGEIVYREYIEEYANYSKEEGKNILDKRLNYFFEDMQEKGVQIIGKDVKMLNDGVQYTYSGSIDLIEAAYVKSEIKTPEDEMGEQSINERN